jgi:hypothetical protein
VKFHPSESARFPNVLVLLDDIFGWDFPIPFVMQKSGKKGANPYTKNLIREPNFSLFMLKGKKTKIFILI